MKFSISTRRGQEKVTAFDGIKEVHGLDGLKEIAKYDHCAVELTQGSNKNGELEKYHRAKECFVRADVLVADFDNGNSENPDEWITPEKLAKELQGVKFFTVYSRHHMKEKNGKPARPKFHSYFPLSREYTDVNEFISLSDKFKKKFPKADKQFVNAVQFTFGVEDVHGAEFAGEKFIDNFLADLLTESTDKGETKIKSETIRNWKYISVEKGQAAPRNAEKESRNDSQERKFTEPIDKPLIKEVQAEFENAGKKIPVGSRNATLYKYAIAVLMNNKETETALSLFKSRVCDCEVALSSNELNIIWKTANDSRLVKARKFASEIIEKHGGNKKGEACREYYSNIQKITPFTAEIKAAFNTAMDIFKSEQKGTETEMNNAPKKTPLTSRNVEAVLEYYKIKLRKNAITGDYEVSGLPDDSEFTPEFYAGLSAGKKKKMAFSSLFDFLTPILKANFSFSENNLKSIVNNIFLAYEYNPVADLMSITDWDKEDRISQLAEILGIEKNQLYCTYLKKWLIQGAAMAFNDDCRPYGNEFVLVLQGEQGIGKTTFFERIALRPEWFNAGVIVDVNNKDTEIRLDQAFINELGEYDQTQKKEQSALRNVITRPISRYRLPYGATDEKIVRHCIFGATVNSDRFLRNADGGTRRDAVIKLTKNFSKEIRDLSDDFIVQLWAQAYVLFKESPLGFRLTYEEREQQERENEAYICPLAGEQEVLEHLDFSADISEWRYFTASEFISRADLKMFTALKIGRALNRIAERDSRIKKIRDRNHNNRYFLPPVKSEFDLKTQNFSEIDFEAENAGNTVEANPAQSTLKNAKFEDFDIPAIYRTMYSYFSKGNHKNFEKWIDGYYDYSDKDFPFYIASAIYGVKIENRDSLPLEVAKSILEQVREYHKTHRPA
mgnify:CR=1 FL=1